jgi:hypothetical protein
VRRSISVDDASAGSLAALLPIMPVTPAASSGGLVHVLGSLGTVPIPSPAPAALASDGPDPMTQTSHAGAPDSFLPRLFVPLADNMHPPMSVRSNNELPIPAVGYLRTPVGGAVRHSRLGGRGVVPWPRAIQYWPSRVAGIPAEGNA